MHDAHRIRVTTSGRTAPLAAEALAFLKDHPSRPLVLHTIPLEPSSKPGLHPATLAAPRLVSLVEKYTETGLVEPTQAERPSLERVLGGKTKPKMTHRPFLQITLSTRPLGLEQGRTGRNVTCQTVFVARRRGRRGGGKSADGEEGDRGEDEPEEDGELGQNSPSDHLGEPVARIKRKSDATPVTAAKRSRT
ncbi:hypothetical protein CspeluHIS016_0401160 [Cutaneotrichosporon spelunceum]|uniref:Uncharacterized protein n=1 Tax=Cutaneotrichosporon spelunceum TaxID=1672016 RepID=A0AAD3TVN8_9TREE|nr:hypothetical protein CspeluHIS016_0401160 [Cutaneotrichosporon spelunceum]